MRNISIDKQVKELTEKLKDSSVDEILKYTLNVKLNFVILPESEDYVQCKLCGKILRSINEHLISYHNISSILYKRIFPFSEILCLKTILKHASKLRINSRSIRLDTSPPDVELESRFNINRVRAYEKVVERDKVCQECGTNESIFDVHHIIPQRLFDRYDFEQDDLENLIYLCKHCHAVYGQQLDDVILDIFENLIKIQFPFSGESIIKILKNSEKSFLKRRPGAPAKYFIDQEDLELFAENSIVDVKTACEVLQMPLRIVKRFCRDYGLAFTITYDFEKKTLETKQCPCCYWSGAVKFTTHLLQTKDNIHQKFLEEFKQKYFELKSTEKVSDFYSKYNFTKVIVSEILDELSVLKKLNCKDYVCPACNKQFRYIVRHLNDTQDDDHIKFCEKLKNLYFVENKSMSLICKELSLEMNFVNGYLKQFLKRG